MMDLGFRLEKQVFRRVLPVVGERCITLSMASACRSRVSLGLQEVTFLLRPLMKTQADEIPLCPKWTSHLIELCTQNNWRKMVLRFQTEWSISVCLFVFLQSKFLYYPLPPVWNACL